MPQVKELKELKLPVGNEIGKTDMAGLVRLYDNPAIFVFVSSSYIPVTERLSWQ